MDTKKTSEHLAQELEKVGLNDMAAKARKNYYHDFFSPIDAPATQLAHDLAKASGDATGERRDAIITLRNRHIDDGEFDASNEESNEWAKSKEGQDTFRELLK